MSSPTIDNWPTIEHILCYLKMVPRRDISYSNHEHNKIEKNIRNFPSQSPSSISTITKCLRAFLSENVNFGTFWISKKHVSFAIF